MVFFKDNGESIHVENQEIPTVSLLICLKNEITNLDQNFSSWKGQVLPNDELILVDDFSEDGTFEKAQELLEGFSNGQCLKASRDRPGKKQALSDGIEKASNKFILVTDADCSPAEKWSTKMRQRLGSNVDIVLGYAPLYSEPGLLNKFQRFETVLTALQYISYANGGLPYMGVGRNLLFRKEIFHSSLYDKQIASGDDDLLVSALANDSNTKVILDPESFVYSKAPKTLRQFIRQKSRHISSSVHYKTKVKFLLGVFSSTQILTHFLLLILIFTPFWLWACILYVMRAFFIGTCLYHKGKMLKETDLYIFTPILDVGLTMYYVLLALIYPFTKKEEWS